MPKGKALTDAEKAEREAAKASKFKELANKRMTNALAAIGSLTGLSNRSSYVYTPEQVKAMGTALVAKVNESLAPFTNPDAKSSVGFDLDTVVSNEKTEA